MTAVKLLILFVLLLVMGLPLIPFRKRSLKGLSFPPPHAKKNAPFLLLAIAEFLLFLLLFYVFGLLGDLLLSIPFVAGLVGQVSAQVALVLRTIFQVVLVNLVALWLYMILKALLRRCLAQGPFAEDLGEEYIKKKKSKNKKGKKKKNHKELSVEERDDKNLPALAEQDDTQGESAEGVEVKYRKGRRIPVYPHTVPGEEERDGTDEAEESTSSPLPYKQHSVFYNKIVGFFFATEQDNFAYVKPWVARARGVLACFNGILTFLSFLMIGLLLVAIFFPGPAWLASLTLFVTDKLYLFPFLALVFLKELVYTFTGPVLPDAARRRREAEREEKKKPHRLRLNRARRELMRKFGRTHRIRYFPPLPQPETDEEPYEPKNTTYRAGLSFIAQRMKNESGRTVKAYMDGLDLLFQGEFDVHFSASFYSELGEYLISYVYIRLLAGERAVFVTSGREQADALRKYIGRRLQDITGTNDQHTWRVRGAEERLDQTDILVCTPDAFRDDNLVENNIPFFEEVVNAFFVDAEAILTLDDYLCPIMANRFQRATDGRIRFVFLTQGILEGIDGAIVRFFCLSQEKARSISGVNDNESVSYYLWNRESNRIYNNGNGHRVTSLENMIAAVAKEAGADGVRVISSAPLDWTELDTVFSDVEINEFHKTVPDINYLIVDDARRNLAAALYIYTRFRGKQASVLHLLNRPYLLREYFMARIGFYIRHTSYIRPRAPEHVNDRKMSLVRILCDATAGQGLAVSEFNRRVMEVIRRAVNEDHVRLLCPFCSKIEAMLADLAGTQRPDVTDETFTKDFCDKFYDSDIGAAYQKAGMKSKPSFELIMAGYLVAGLTDSEETLLDDSHACQAQTYTSLSQHLISAGQWERCISFNNVKQLFEALLACNRRVEIWLNDECLGTLPLFVTRVFQTYLPGQTIIYKNIGYDIESIDKDGARIHLARRKETLCPCLETLPLRRFTLYSLSPKGEEPVSPVSAEGEQAEQAPDRMPASIHCGEVTYSFFYETAPLKTVRMTRRRVKLLGETFGFYNLMYNQQTLDFAHRAEGNLSIPDSVIKKGARDLARGRVLEISLVFNMACNDRERLLLAAVFNELLPTIFPDAASCLAFCPVLTEPVKMPDDERRMTYEDHVRTLYPFLTEASYAVLGEEAVEENEIRLFLINDCVEDVGVLDLFYDGSTSYLKQLLVNIHGYLHWLKKNPTLPSGQKHYIAFGRDEFPSEIFDLEGLCDLLEGLDLIFSDRGEGEHAIVSNDEENDGDEADDLGLCAFCHEKLEENRYAAFDDVRCICNDCFSASVNDEATLKALLTRARDYLKKTYPEKDLSAPDATAVFDAAYRLNKGQEFSEYYSHVDESGRVIHVEIDDPDFVITVSLLRGLVRLWQVKQGYHSMAARAQLYYEELRYLKSLNMDTAYDWIKENLDPALKNILDSMEAWIQAPLPAAPTGTTETRTSFDYLDYLAREQRLHSHDDEEDDEDEMIDGQSGLFDPNATKRFWKRFLRDQGAEDYEDEKPDPIDDDTDDTDDTDNTDNTDNTDDIDTPEDDEDDGIDIYSENIPMQPNAPAPGDSDLDSPVILDDPMDDATDEPSDELSDEPTDAESDKERKKRERQAERDRKKKEKQEEKERKKKEKQEEREQKKKEKQEKKKKKTPEPSPMPEPLPVPSPSPTPEPEPEPESEKKNKRKKTPEPPPKKPKPKKKKSGMADGTDLIPIEDDEATNPKIAFYNQFARAAYLMSDAAVEVKGLSGDEVDRIFYMICSDYPEFFWLSGYRMELNGNTVVRVRPSYRFVKGGTVDKKAIKAKRRELSKGAAPFLKGITRKTPVFDAILTVYRRLILTLDYDDRGLAAHVDRDFTRDDALRSLHSALVDHKVVCAGYAVAMQYLLQSLGITAAYVISDPTVSGDRHAFNIVKIKDKCYYLDATWGDSSNTTKETNDQLVRYSYFCTPFSEFIAPGDAETVALHTPSREVYPFNEVRAYANTHYEYYRHEGYYFETYDLDVIAAAFAKQAQIYRQDLMGDFALSVRFATIDLANFALTRINAGDWNQLILKAHRLLGKKDKKAKARLEEMLSGAMISARGAVVMLHPIR